MAAAPQALAPPPSAAAAAPNPGKRKRPPKGKGKANKKKRKQHAGRAGEEPARRRRRNKPSAKFLKVLRKRARDYNSDDSNDDGGGGEEGDRQQEQPPSPRRGRLRHEGHDGEAHSEEEGEDAAASSSGDEDEASGGGGVGVTRFEQGCRAFRVAFLKIMAKNLPDDPLGPILSAHKKLVAAKLAEEVKEHKPKSKARKEKRAAAAEKGHITPKDHLDTKEKDLIKIATQGVVRLFNAVSKAQNSRKDLNPSRTKDAKVLAKERKKTFLEQLQTSSRQDEKNRASSSSKLSKNIGKDEDEPGWAPLRDTYMLGSKLKNWDKMQDSAAASEQAEAPLGGSSDDDE